MASAEFADTQESFDIFNLRSSVDFEKWDEHNAHVFTRSAMAKDIIPLLRNWDYNRSLDEQHKNDIKDALYAQKYPYINGIIKVVVDDAFRPIVIDGQHRLVAIQEIISERPDYNIKLLFNIFKLLDIPDITSCSKTVYEKISELYKIINMSMPIDRFHSKELKAVEITEEMGIHPSLKDGIVRHPTGSSVHKPRISYKSLKDTIFKYLPDDCKHIDSKVFTRKTVGKNTELSLMSAEEIYGRINPAKEKLRHYDKAKNKKFFLNLDGAASPDTWIKDILKTL